MKIRSLIIVSLLLVANFISLAQASPYVKTTTKSIPAKDIKTIDKQQNNESIDVDLNEAESRNLSDIIEDILPTVVAINTIKNNSYNGDYYSDDSSNTVSLGSGFIISDDGYIITNNHVIKDGEKINVKLKGSETNFPAEIIGVDEIMDIALLKISLKTKLPYAEFDETRNYKVGDTIIVVGNPYNLGISVSSGIISALNRNLQMSSFDNFIQTDASINKGNSGGPMFNLRGKVIGLTSTIYSPDGGNIGIGFAMPTTDLLPIIEELKRYGYVRRGYIGITTENAQKEIFEALNGSNRRGGVIITSVVGNSSAEKSGLNVSDIILKYNGKRIRNTRDLSVLISSTEIGSTVKLEVLRNNKIINILVKVDENKENYKYDPDYEILLSKAVEVFDMVLIPVNKESKKRFNISKDSGMYVLKTKKGGLADKKGIRTGDVIISINQDQALNRDVITKNIHDAKLNKINYVFLIVSNSSKNNLIFMSLEDSKLSSNGYN